MDPCSVSLPIGEASEIHDKTPLDSKALNGAMRQRMSSRTLRVTQGIFVYRRTSETTVGGN